MGKWSYFWRKLNYGANYAARLEKGETGLVMPRNVEKPSLTVAKMIALSILDFTGPTVIREDESHTMHTYTVSHPKFKLKGFVLGPYRHDPSYHLYDFQSEVGGIRVSFTTEEQKVITDAFGKWKRSADERKKIKEEADRQQKACDAIQAWFEVSPTPAIDDDTHPAIEALTQDGSSLLQPEGAILCPRKQKRCTSNCGKPIYPLEPDGAVWPMCKGKVKK